MATLNTYTKQVTRFLNDANQMLVDPQDIVEHVNQARRETAMRAACIRVLPAISAPCVSVNVTSGGTGYTSPTVVISPPDMPSGFLPLPNGAQATASAVLIDGQIQSVNIVYGGAGYFQPTVAITDPTGTGFAGTVTTGATLTLNEGQEQYPFTSADLSIFPGVASIYLVRSISIIFSNYRYSIPVYSFSTYQADIRNYVASQYQYVGCYGAQFGRGTSGTMFIYPPPSGTYQQEWDCQCLPMDLTTNQSVEAIPDPFTDAVPYYAAHLCFLQLQNHNTARSFLQLYDDRMARFGAYTLPGRRTNPYGRF